jgi:hypothetical protein
MSGFLIARIAQHHAIVIERVQIAFLPFILKHQLSPFLSNRVRLDPYYLHTTGIGDRVWSVFFLARHLLLYSSITHAGAINPAGFS